MKTNLIFFGNLSDSKNGLIRSLIAFYVLIYFF